MCVHNTPLYYIIAEVANTCPSSNLSIDGRCWLCYSASVKCITDNILALIAFTTGLKRSISKKFLLLLSMTI